MLDEPEQVAAVALPGPAAHRVVAGDDEPRLAARRQLVAQEVERGVTGGDLAGLGVAVDRDHAHGSPPPRERVAAAVTGQFSLGQSQVAERLHAVGIATGS